MSYSERVGAYCRKHRLEILHKTLDDIRESVNLKTLSAFESGRSTNMLHVAKYLKAGNEEQKRIFIDGLNRILRGL